jgi:regulator of ribonuclease activity A
MTTLPTCDLCDAHKAEAGAALRVLPPLFHSWGGRAAFAGPVATVACFEDNTVVKAAVESPGHGRVLVVDGGGSLRRALVGGNLAASAAKNGWAGVVVFGAVRDVAELRATDLGVCALALVPLAGERRGAGQRDGPVQIAGVRVNPGDWLVADDDGLVVLGAELAAQHGWSAAPGG